MTGLIEFLLAVGLPILAWRKMLGWMIGKGHGKFLAHFSGAGIAAVSFFVVMMVIVTIDPPNNEQEAVNTAQTAPAKENSPPPVAVEKKEEQPNPEPRDKPEPQPATAVKAEPTSPPPEKKEETPPQPTALKVSAVRLFDDYDENEVAADDRYREKSLEVVGVVDSIDKTPFGGIVVKLKTGNPFMSVDANLDDGMKEKAGKLKKGQRLTVRCDGDGSMLGSPQLSDCQL